MLRRIAALSLIAAGALVISIGGNATAIPIDIIHQNGPENCFGTGCYAKDPTKTTCLSDAKTIAAMDVSGRGMLELRWSKQCGAGWGRFTGYTRGGYNLGHVTLETTTAMTPYVAQGNADPVRSAAEGLSYWSFMVPDEKVFCTRAQLHIFERTPGGTSYEETDSWWSDRLCSYYN
jgi:hypothetical protein